MHSAERFLSNERSRPAVVMKVFKELSGVGLLHECEGPE